MDRKNFRIATLEAMKPEVGKTELAESVGLSRSQLWRRMKTDGFQQSRAEIEDEIRELSVAACRQGIEKLLDLMGSENERIALEAARSVVLLHIGRSKYESKQTHVSQVLPSVEEAIAILQNDLRVC